MQLVESAVGEPGARAISARAGRQRPCADQAGHQIGEPGRHLQLIMPAVASEPNALAGFHLENPAQATLIVLAFDVAAENQEREKQLFALAADTRT